MGRTEHSLPNGRLILRNIKIKVFTGPGVTVESAQQQTATELQGEVTRISFRNEENGYTVLRLTPPRSPNPITVTGVFTLIEEGEYINLTGQWSVHKKYGRQFRSLRRIPHNTEEGIVRYLASRQIKGIGDVTARKIVDYFGIKTLDVLDDSPARLMEVPSIGPGKTRTIVREWEKHRTGREVEMFLINNGLSPSLAVKILAHYGDRTQEMVSQNPYRLAMDIRGIGFLTADAVARKIGVPDDSPERIKAAIQYQLRKAEAEGHCYLDTAGLLEELPDTLKIPAEKLLDVLAGCLMDLNTSNHLVSIKMGTGDEETRAHYLRDLYDAETMVGEHVRRLLDSPLERETDRIDTWLQRYSERSRFPLTDSQLDGVRKAAGNRVFILTGGPGVGKTTTANAIIRLFSAMGLTVALAAPTGRAAQRMADLTGSPSSTIHRLLEWNPGEGGFKRNEDNPLEADTIVIDEASMLDIRLAASLLRAVPDRACLILIGDVDQLPSVGPGNVLYDLIQSGEVPCKRLNEVFRQASTSLIIRAAHEINGGYLPTFNNEPGSDCHFLEAESPEAVQEIIRDLVRDRLPGKGYDSIRDIQVLTPMNRGHLGTDTLNRVLQEALNPKLRDMHEFRRDQLLLRPGDKVIQSSNNYDLGVFNGDIGLVTEAAVEGGKVRVMFNERILTYEKDHINDLRLAYAITIHKSQGSEFPVVLIPVTMHHYIMLQRNLIYTALTRARRLAIFIGNRQALDRAVRNHLSLKRLTRLAPTLSATGGAPAS